MKLFGLKSSYISLKKYVGFAEKYGDLISKKSSKSLIKKIKPSNAALRPHPETIANNRSIIDGITHDYGFQDSAMTKKYLKKTFQERRIADKTTKADLEKVEIMNPKNGKIKEILGTEEDVLYDMNLQVGQFGNHNHNLVKRNITAFEEVEAMPSSTDLLGDIANPTKLSTISTENYLTLMKNNNSYMYKATPEEILKKYPDEAQRELIFDLTQGNKGKGFSDEFAKKISSVADKIENLTQQRDKVLAKSYYSNVNPSKSDATSVMSEAKRLFKEIGDDLNGKYEQKHWQEIFPNLRSRGKNNAA